MTRFQRLKYHAAFSDHVFVKTDTVYNGNNDKDRLPYRLCGKNTRKRRNKMLRVFIRDDFECQECGSDYDLTVDHIIPKSKGGLDTYSNLETLCRKCNCDKGNKHPEPWSYT